MAHDIFISFSFADQKIAEEIVNQLQGKYGISCWICTHDIQAGANYKEAIVTAITEAKAFVLVQTVNAMNSTEVPKETSLAMTRQKVIIPFTLDDSVLPPKFEYDLADVQRIDARKPTLNDRICDLAAEIRKVIGPSKTEENNTGSDDSEPKLQSSKISCISGFMGRETELKKIHENLLSYGRVFLYGIGGIGKSEIAKQYAVQYSKEYDVIIFATYSSTLQEMITNNSDIVIKNFSKASGETEEAYFKRKLTRIKAIATERTLIIVDNFDTDYDDDLEEFVDGTYKILFTTRNDHSDTGCPVIAVEELSEDEQYEMFIKIYNRPLRGDDSHKIREILRHINGHTLTIELVAKMTQTKRQPAKILEAMLNSGISSALTGTVKHGFKNDIAYMYIQRLFSMSTLSEEELGIMMNLSLMPLDGVDFVEFAEWCALDDYETLDNLIKRSWIIYDIKADKVRLHPLICEVVANDYRPDWEKCGALLERIIDRVSDHKWENMSFDEISRYATCFISMISKTGKLPDKYAVYYGIIFSIVNFIEKRDFCLYIAKLNQEFWLLHSGDKSYETGKSYYYLGITYGDNGDYRQATDSYRISSNILRFAIPQTLDLAYILKHTALSILRFGSEQEYEEAYCLLNECKSICENYSKEYTSWVGSIDDFKASLYYSYALYYDKKRESELALQYAQQSCSLFANSSSSFSKVMRNSAFSLMALIHSKNNDPERALYNIDEAIDITKAFYSHNHARLLSMYERKAEVCHNLKLYKEEMDIWLKIKSELENKNENGTSMHCRVITKLEECQRMLSGTEPK